MNPFQRFNTEQFASSREQYKPNTQYIPPSEPRVQYTQFQGQTYHSSSSAQTPGSSTTSRPLQTLASFYATIKPLTPLQSQIQTPQQVLPISPQTPTREKDKLTGVEVFRRTISQADFDTTTKTMRPIPLVSLHSTSVSVRTGEYLIYGIYLSTTTNKDNKGQFYSQWIIHDLSNTQIRINIYEPLRAHYEDVLIQRTSRPGRVLESHTDHPLEGDLVYIANPRISYRGNNGSVTCTLDGSDQVIVIGTCSHYSRCAGIRKSDDNKCSNPVDTRAGLFCAFHSNQILHANDRPTVYPAPLSHDKKTNAAMITLASGTVPSPPKQEDAGENILFRKHAKLMGKIEAQTAKDKLQLAKKKKMAPKLPQPTDPTSDPFLDDAFYVAMSKRKEKEASREEERKLAQKKEAHQKELEKRKQIQLLREKKARAKAQKQHLAELFGESDEEKPQNASTNEAPLGEIRKVKRDKPTSSSNRSPKQKPTPKEEIEDFDILSDLIDIVEATQTSEPSPPPLDEPVEDEYELCIVDEQDPRSPPLSPTQKISQKSSSAKPTSPRSLRTPLSPPTGLPKATVATPPISSKVDGKVKKRLDEAEAQGKQTLEQYAKRQYQWMGEDERSDLDRWLSGDFRKKEAFTGNTIPSDSIVRSSQKSFSAFFPQTEGELRTQASKKMAHDDILAKQKELAKKINVPKTAPNPTAELRTTTLVKQTSRDTKKEDVHPALQALMDEVQKVIDGSESIDAFIAACAADPGSHKDALDFEEYQEIMRKTDTLEMHERIEEKRQSIHKIRISMFHCSRCGIIPKKRADLCVEDNKLLSSSNQHVLRPFSTWQRFFSCTRCGYRTSVVHSTIPTMGCVKCGAQSAWTKASMFKQRNKVVDPLKRDESTFTVMKHDEDVNDE
ncbi:putative minichromosome maintenance protein 10 [Blattamonas nauphoetae]|uniref:Protein MCM10 homolog n=1 Tax=Blattamonas nauphoetae TaxID=2049346 RepID=A0ABQ9YF66_9EUKA|nr:putative minichromosome maintenance protein 10 [Blattamonas nauphoetae]